MIGLITGTVYHFFTCRAIYKYAYHTLKALHEGDGATRENLDLYTNEALRKYGDSSLEYKFFQAGWRKAHEEFIAE